MKLYAAIDLHSTNNVPIVIDEHDTIVVKPKRAPNDAAAVLKVFEPYKDDIQGVVVESTYNGYWLIDALEAAKYKVKLAHAPAIKQYDGLKHGDDDSDAFHLAHLLRLGILPTGHICPQPVRAQRDLMRRRLALVQQHTRAVLMLQSMYARVLGRNVRQDDLEKADINADFVQPADRLAALTLREICESVQQGIDALERGISAELQDSAQLRLLRTIPGLGRILGTTILLETGDITRFASVGNYVSYCRLVDSHRWSNDKRKGHGNRKSGNAYLCWAWIEVANFAVRYDETVRRWFERKRSAVKLRVIAIKAVAHKLARAAYHMLRENKPFDVHRAFD